MALSSPAASPMRALRILKSSRSGSLPCCSVWEPSPSAGRADRWSPDAARWSSGCSSSSCTSASAPGSPSPVRRSAARGSSSCSCPSPLSRSPLRPPRPGGPAAVRGASGGCRTPSSPADSASPASTPVPPPRRRAPGRIVSLPDHRRTPEHARRASGVTASGCSGGVSRRTSWRPHPGASVRISARHPGASSRRAA